MKEKFCQLIDYVAFGRLDLGSVELLADTATYVMVEAVRYRVQWQSRQNRINSDRSIIVMQNSRYRHS